jgi:hypothetical protein
MYIRKRLEDADFIFDAAKGVITFSKAEMARIKAVDYSQSYDDIVKNLMGILNDGELQFDESSWLFKLKCDWCEKDCDSIVVNNLEDGFGSKELVCKECLIELISEM